HHRIAAGKQHIRHIGFAAHIRRETLSLAACELQILQPYKLGPPETESAIGVAGLTGRGEKQHGLTVFVLYATEPFAVEHGHIELKLTGRMGVHSEADLVNDRLELF